ncbi:TPA: hypothetical protein DHU97_02485 [Candidatus Saccharibacteria bacterium]|nr:hypothetical protein [Candidatus Saccharibacteria bacterium]
MSRRRRLYSGKSSYGSYEVVDTIYSGRRARLLYGDKNTPQSGVALDDEGELLFDYNQRFLEMIESAQPKKILVIGGGVLMLPVAVYDRFADMKIDVVEIDPLLIQLAHDFFRVPTENRFQIFTGDGRAFLEQTTGQYDMIIIDAFHGFTTPIHLLEHTAAVLYQQHLTESGVVTINFISQFIGRRQQLAHEMMATFLEVFPACELYQADPHQAKGDEQNLLLVAGTQSIHFDYLQSHSVSQLMMWPNQPPQLHS